MADTNTPNTANPQQPNSQPANAAPGASSSPDPLSKYYGSAQPGEGVLLTPSQQAAAGPQAQPKSVQMEVLRDGSFNGEYRKVGDTVDVNEDQVETLTLSGFAARKDRGQANPNQLTDQQSREALAKRRGGRSTSTAPLGTRDMSAQPANAASNPNQPEPSRGDSVNPPAPNTPNGESR